MGGFAALLGHAASGFEQARQQDISRQFADEQNRRAMAGELLHGLITDPNQSPELRNAALSAYQQNLMPTKTGVGKPLDMGKVFGPIADVAAQVRARAQQPQTATPGPITPGAPLQVPAPPTGAGAQVTQGVNPPVGPPQTGAPQISMPPRPLAFAGQDVQAPLQAAAPAPPLLAGVPQIAQNAATLGAAQSGGQLTGQMQARSEFAKQIMSDPQYGPMIEQDPMMKAMLGSMIMGVQLPFSAFGMMNRNVGTGGGYARDLRAQGLDVPANIKDDQWVNMRELAGGRRTFEPAAAPGEKALGNGQLGGVSEQETTRQAASYPFWAKKNAIQFGQKQSLLNQAFQLGVDRGYLGDANKAFVESVKDYGTSVKTMQSMDEAYKAVQQNPNNQQAQVALLMAHIGMTLGVVKGARVGKAQIQDAEESRTALAGLSSKLNFDKDGNLDWSDPIRKGVTLTPDQMKQMVELGHQRMQIMHENIGRMHDQLDPAQMETQPIGTNLGPPSPTKISNPPKPSGSAKKKQAYQLNGKWYDAQTHQEIKTQ